MSNQKVTFDVQRRKPEKWLSLKINVDTIAEAEEALKLLRCIPSYGSSEFRIIKRTVIEEVVSGEDKVPASPEKRHGVP